MALSLRGASYSDASMALSETGPVASVLVNPVELTVAVKQIPGHLADRVGHKMGLALQRRRPNALGARLKTNELKKGEKNKVTCRQADMYGYSLPPPSFSLMAKACAA